jgi:nucleoside-diphosphate kinase
VFNDGPNIVMVGHAEDGFNKILDIMNKLRVIPNHENILFSSNGQQTNELQELLFNSKTVPSTATLDSSTCVVIKPHAVKSRFVGSIVKEIIGLGYDISAIKSLQFDKTSAEEFLEVYRGVLPEYSEYVIQLSTGLSIALEVRAENAVQTFRMTAGPWDTSMAKELYPNSLRGKFAIDNIRNAVHCTDLTQDAIMECEYIFNILD